MTLFRVKYVILIDKLKQIARASISVKKYFDVVIVCVHQECRR